MTNRKPSGSAVGAEADSSDRWWWLKDKMHILIPSINSGIYTPKLVRELIYKSGCAHDHSHDALHDYIINLHTML